MLQDKHTQVKDILQYGSLLVCVKKERFPGKGEGRLLVASSPTFSPGGSKRDIRDFKCDTEVLPGKGKQSIFRKKVNLIIR